jgi:hypothetical protein
MIRLSHLASGLGEADPSLPSEMLKYTPPHVLAAQCFINLAQEQLSFHLQHSVLVQWAI